MTTPRVTVPVEQEFAHYRRSQIAHLRPYVAGETLSDRVSISSSDLEAGSPKPGDMIARNPANHDDQWLVAADYFAANFEPVSAAPAPEGGAVQWGWRVRSKPSKTPCHRPWHWQADEPTGITAELCEWEPVYVSLATREEAPAEAGSMIVKTPCQHCLRMTTVTPESLALYRDHLRAQPQAREDAQPVVEIVLSNKFGSGVSWLDGKLPPLNLFGEAS